MSAAEYQGIITAVQATSSHVKVQLDTVPGKTFAWRMTQFVSKPRPEVGNRIILTARPGRLHDYEVASLIAIGEAEVPPVPTELQAAVSTELPTNLPTNLPTLPPPASGIDELAERILELKTKCKQAVAQGLLDFKWEVGREISVHRGEQDPETFRALAEKTGIVASDLVCCVQFYRKFPSKGYELKAWRELRAELPEKAEAAEKPALVVDAKHLWVCPECGVKFEHLHNPNGKHGLREVNEK